MTSVRFPTRDPAAGFPKRFGNFVLLARLAYGGMGEVFLAKHRNTREGFQKFVVLKRLLPHLMDEPKFVAMFKDEARIAARISHSNVCQTYELGEADGMYYMAMEYLEGVSFGRVIKDRKRDRRLGDMRLLGRLLMQVCEGLHSAHELRDENRELVGVVHRDVCHSNIFVTSTGVAKVLDFGVAKARGALDKTRTGAVKGTYAYSSPEQLRGEEVDRRSDIFSIGVVAWEALTRRRLFKRETDYLCFKAITDERIPSPLTVRPDIAPRVAQAIEKALSRDRNDRQATARELGVAIGEGMRGLGPPMSSVAVASLMEDAFAKDFKEQRRLCGQESGDDSSVASRDNTMNERTLVRAKPRIRMPLPPSDNDTQDIPTVRAGAPYDPDDDEPEFTFTPVNTELPYSQETPLYEGPPEQDEGPTEEMAPDAMAEFIRTATASPIPYKPSEPSKPREPTETDEPRGRRSSLAITLFVGGLVVIAALALMYFVRNSGGDDGAGKTVATPAVEKRVEPRPAPAPAIEPKPVATVEPKPVPEPEAEAEPEAEPKPEPKLEPKLEPKVAPKTKPKVAPKTKPKVAPKTKPKRKSKVAPKRKPKPKIRRKRDPGYLTVAAHPYATIYVDGKKKGVTPLVRLPLPPGTHSVRAVSSDDGSVKRFKVKVKSGETSRKKITW